MYRQLQNVLSLMTLFVLAASFYFQYIQGLQPCPLCLMQRFCTMALLLFCMMGACLSTLKRGRLVAVFQMLTALAGMFFAVRQMWLQSLPQGQVSVCLPGLDILMQYFSWHDVLRALLWGAGDCAEVTWQWLGLSMPAWALVYFITLFVVSLAVFLQLGRMEHRLIQKNE